MFFRSVYGFLVRFYHLKNFTFCFLAFDETFPKYGIPGVKHSRFDVWSWVIENDGAVRKVLTDHGKLNSVMAADHVVQCYNYHSKLVHDHNFSVYEKIPVLNMEQINKGYISNELPFSRSRNRIPPMQAEDTVRILLGLSKFAGFLHPERIDV